MQYSKDCKVTGQQAIFGPYIWFPERMEKQYNEIDAMFDQQYKLFYTHCLVTYFSHLSVQMLR